MAIIDASRAESFTDDTTLPRVELRVAISGQVVKEHPLDWFYRLRSLCGPVVGEIKRVAVNTFFGLPLSNRILLFRTLKKVRIHITDARLYVADVADSFQHMLPPGITAVDFVKDGSHASLKHLDGVRDAVRDWIASNIIYDSAAQRLLIQYRAWEYCSGQRLHITDAMAREMGLKATPLPVVRPNLEDLRAGKSKVLRGAVDGAAASASVFTPATDKFEDALQYSSTEFRGLAGQFLLNSALRPCRAFDEGHSNVVRWVERQRTVVLANANTHTFLYKPEPLIEVGSAGSVHTQAADIAAGIAREMWIGGSLVRLAHSFEYLTYNGERISELKAATIQRTIDSL